MTVALMVMPFIQRLLDQRRSVYDDWRCSGHADILFLLVKFQMPSLDVADTTDFDLVKTAWNAPTLDNNKFIIIKESHIPKMH